MYMKSLIPDTAALLLLAACGQRNASRQTAPAAAQTAVPDMHDAENALDYQGTYTGVFPAADVPGIAVTPKDIPAYYRVGENRLWRRDSHQQPITGPFADQYILTKSDSATPAGCY